MKAVASFLPNNLAEASDDNKLSKSLPIARFATSNTPKDSPIDNYLVATDTFLIINHTSGHPFIPMIQMSACTSRWFAYMQIMWAAEMTAPRLPLVYFMLGIETIQTEILRKFSAEIRSGLKYHLKWTILYRSRALRMTYNSDEDHKDVRIRRFQAIGGSV